MVIYPCICFCICYTAAIHHLWFVLHSTRHYALSVAAESCSYFLISNITIWNNGFPKIAKFFPVPCLFAPKAQKGIDKGKKSTRFWERCIVGYKYTWASKSTWKSIFRLSLGNRPPFSAQDRRCFAKLFWLIGHCNQITARSACSIAGIGYRQ